MLTDVSGGASARLELGFVPWLDLRLGALGSVIEGQTLGEFDQGTFAAALIAGRGDVCLAHSLAQLRLLACGGGMAGMFGTRGEAGFATKIVQNSPWGALVGSLEAQAELASWLSFSVAVDLVLPFAKRTIRVADASGETAASRTLSSVAVLVGAGPVVRVF